MKTYGRPGEYQLATMLPTALLQAFNKPEVSAVAQEVEEVIVALMHHAAGSTQN